MTASTYTTNPHARLPLRGALVVWGLLVFAGWSPVFLLIWSLT